MCVCVCVSEPNIRNTDTNTGWISIIEGRRWLNLIVNHMQRDVKSRLQPSWPTEVWIKIVFFWPTQSLAVQNQAAVQKP